MMRSAVVEYFRTLCDRFGQGWNRFWFTPSDPHALSALRIVAGLMAWYVLLTYSFDLERFFGPGGMLPLDLVAQLNELEAGARGAVRWSYLDYIHDVGTLWAMHVAGLVVVGLFAVGFLTRITSVLSFVVFLSYLHRAPVVTSHVEPILVFLLLYLCLGPAGACFSVDRWLADRRRRARPVSIGDESLSPRSGWATVAVRLIQVHLVFVYLSMGLGKVLGDVWWNGSAVWWLAARPESRLVDLTWLHSYPLLFNVWTLAVVVFELGFVVFVWNSLARPLVLGIGVLLWASLAVVTGSVAWCVLMCLANVVFVSPESLRAAAEGCCRRPSPLGNET